LAQGGESFDYAQDREPVERLVEPFEIWCLGFGILPGLSVEVPVLAFPYPYTRNLTPETQMAEKNTRLFKFR